MHVFLSYDSHDEAFANVLRRKLDELGVNVWNPTIEILPGSNWALETGKALERAKAVIFIVTPHSVSSKAWRHEVQFALGNGRFENRVFPISIGRVPYVPWAIRSITIRAGKKDAPKVAETIAKRLKPRARLKAGQKKKAKSQLRTRGSKSLGSVNGRAS
jgi:hypothetical protein